jgi:hypothetical protein
MATIKPSPKSMPCEKTGQTKSDGSKGVMPLAQFSAKKIDLEIVQQNNDGKAGFCFLHLQR